jgi:hypothetical protein
MIPRAALGLEGRLFSPHADPNRSALRHACRAGHAADVVKRSDEIQRTHRHGIKAAMEPEAKTAGAGSDLRPVPMTLDV